MERTNEMIASDILLSLLFIIYLSIYLSIIGQEHQLQFEDRSFDLLTFVVGISRSQSIPSPHQSIGWTSIQSCERSILSYLRRGIESLLRAGSRITPRGNILSISTPPIYLSINRNNLPVHSLNSSFFC